MTNVAISRREDDLGAKPADRTFVATMEAAAPKAATENEGSAALKAIVTYIPTEIITLYVAALAAVGTGGATPSAGEWITYWTFLCLTPIIVWTVYAGKVKTGGANVPINPTKWPW